jgi:hypothetical protein
VSQERAMLNKVVLQHTIPTKTSAEANLVRRRTLWLPMLARRPARFVRSVVGAPLNGAMEFSASNVLDHLAGMLACLCLETSRWPWPPTRDRRRKPDHQPAEATTAGLPPMTKLVHVKHKSYGVVFSFLWR